MTYKTKLPKFSEDCKYKTGDEVVIAMSPNSEAHKVTVKFSMGVGPQCFYTHKGSGWWNISHSSGLGVFDTRLLKEAKLAVKELSEIPWSVDDVDRNYSDILRDINVIRTKYRYIR